MVSLLADVAPDLSQGTPLALLLGALLAGVALVVLLVTHVRRTSGVPPE